jgi:hypothetical protein
VSSNNAAGHTAVADLGTFGVDWSKDNLGKLDGVAMRGCRPHMLQVLGLPQQLATRLYPVAGELRQALFHNQACIAQNT